MKNTKLIAYLQTLSKKEIQCFDEFVNSSYHNKSKLAIKFWTYLKPYAPKFEHENLEKSQLIIHLYDSVNQNSTKRFNDLAVTFCKLFERFITLQSLDKNTIYQERLLINAFSEKRLSRAFYKRIKKDKKQIEKKVIKDIEDYEQLLFLETEYFFFDETSKVNVDDKVMQNILDINENLFMLKKLKYTFEAKQIELFINRQFHISSPILKIEDFKFFENNLLIKIYNSQLVLLNQEENKRDNFNKLKLLFEENINHLISSKESFNILNFLIGFTTIQINKGEIAFYQEMFDLIQVGIERKILFENNCVNKIYFENLCIIAAELGHQEWLERFLAKEQHYSFIQKKDRNEVRAFCEIILNYGKQDFDNVLFLLNNFKTDTIDLEFWYRTMELRCLYELRKINNYFELIDARVEAFKRYCYRMEVLQKNKITSNLNFIKYYLRLLHEAHLLKQDKEKATKELRVTTTVCKLWLLRNIKAL